MANIDATTLCPYIKVKFTYRTATTAVRPYKDKSTGTMCIPTNTLDGKTSKIEYPYTRSGSATLPDIVVLTS